MKSDVLRMLGWVIPLVCMSLAGWIIFSQQQAFGDASLKRNQANRDIITAENERKLYVGMKPTLKYAAEAQTASEDDAFLNYLKVRCAANGVRFDQYHTQTVIYGKDKGSTPTDQKVAALLKGIERVSCTLTLVGTYQSIRRFLGELEASDRLYSITNVAWSLAKEGTTLTMTISRYVEPPAQAGLPKAPAKKLPSISPLRVKPGAVGPSMSIQQVRTGAAVPTVAVPLPNPGANRPVRNPRSVPPPVIHRTLIPMPGHSSKP